MLLGMNDKLNDTFITHASDSSRDVSEKAPRALLKSAVDKLERMALTIDDGDNPEAYRTCCHAYTARIIRDHMHAIKDTDQIVLLGNDGIIAHSILANEEGEILADSKFGLKRLEPELDLDARKYVVPFNKEKGLYRHMDVMFKAPISDFKESFLKSENTNSHDVVSPKNDAISP